jgi:hypothetical protein
MADMLQRYLSSGLLDIGDDDTRLSKLRDAAADLQKLFNSQPRTGLYHALMVYSENVDSEDQSFVETAEALSKHWNTYKNRYPDTPRALFRAMAIHAVSEAAASDPDLEVAVAYGLRSLGEHPNGANEGPILQEYYREASNKLEQRAISSWRLNQPNPFPPLKPTAVAAPAVDKATLDAGINPDTVTNTLTKLATGIVSEVNKNLKTTTDQVSSNVGAAQQGFRDLAASIFQRTELLWWKESRFSPILRKPYQDLPATVAAIFMALDLHTQLSGVAPLSVDFFLSETVTQLLGVQAKTSWTQLVTDLSMESPIAEAFLSLMPNVPVRHGLRTIVERLRDDLQLKLTGTKPSKASGKSTKEKEIELRQLAVNTYLALQALRFSPEKTDGKKV